jgi:hypothetical protein
VTAPTPIPAAWAPDLRKAENRMYLSMLVKL